MDELTLLRSTRDAKLEPSAGALASGRAALLGRIAGEIADTSTLPARKKHKMLPRLTWAGAGIAAAMIGVLVVGNVHLSTQSAYASVVLRDAAAQTIQYADLVPGPGEYLRSHTRGRWQTCASTGDSDEMTCGWYEETVDVYKPADPGAEWVLYRERADVPGAAEGPKTEYVRAVQGDFYIPGSSVVSADYAELPIDGAEAYAWIDAQYIGGSSSRDEDNFVRIADLLRSGLIPAAQRAALLDALSRIPGVTATDNVANLDGVVGVAIGRNEPVRAGERAEILIDPNTGLIIGERTLAGTRFFGWGPNEEVALTAMETTIVSSAP